MFWTDLLSIIRSLNTLYTAIGICHTSYVDCLLADSQHNQYDILLAQFPKFVSNCVWGTAWNLKMGVRSASKMCALGIFHTMDSIQLNKGVMNKLLTQTVRETLFFQFQIWCEAGSLCTSISMGLFYKSLIKDEYKALVE